MSSAAQSDQAKVIKVLIVEDSATARQLLVTILGMDPQLAVCGVAVDGQQAVNMTLALRPDVILMDIQMPVMNGFEATKIIMAERPTPIIVVSLHRNVSEITVALEALRAGAVTILPKPHGLASAKFQSEAEHLLATVRAMAGVTVRRPRSASDDLPVPPEVPASAVPRRKVELIVVAASTGGPAALHRILSSLPVTFTTPIVIVQHMSQGFHAGLVSSLGRVSALRVVLAQHQSLIEPRTVYLAPFGRNLVVRDKRTLALVAPRETELFCPAANVLFTTAADVFRAAVVALVLTGMGSDGLDGCRAVSGAGGLVVAQDERSSLIFGMPKEVIASGVAQHVLSVHEMARWLTRLTAG